MAHSIKSVRHLLNDKPALRRIGSEINAQQALLGAVRRQLPTALAGHCIAARSEGHRLILHTDSPVWASRLRFVSAELRSLLQNDHPALSEVKIRLLPGRGPVPRRHMPARRSSRGAETVLASAVHTEPTPLREALERLGRRLKPD